MTNCMSHNDDVIRCQITDSEEIDDSQNAVSTLLENFELPDIGNVKDTKFALKTGKKSLGGARMP